MQSLYKLDNTVKHYEWGSVSDIPKLLGKDNGTGEPWAELWMGVHPGGPSKLKDEGRSLAGLIAGDPPRYTGKTGSLPFLFKLLAASRPLSIQAHPSLEQAREGFERENRAGLAADDPKRNYKDANHKPEILCALKPFKAMCGFREPEEIQRRLDGLFGEAPVSLREGLAPLHEALETGLKAFFRALFSLSPETLREMTGFIVENMKKKITTKLPREPVSGFFKEHEGEFLEEWECAASFAELYPGDPGIIAPLYLNLIDLEAGEAVFLPAGILHAYIRGFGVELMANSDNVLRGGLTPKYVDVDELVRILVFSPFKPKILRPEPFSPAASRYHCPCGDFSLTVMKGAGENVPYQAEGPSIIIVTDGELRAGADKKTYTLNKGESAFIPAESRLTFSGSYTLYAAGAGEDPR
jgi:mannose-6-phosphate isomerase